MGIYLDNQYLADIISSQCPVIEIPALSAFPELINGFTTRFGGASTGDYATLNLNFARADAKSNVLRNFGILSAKLGVQLNNMVLSHQVHSINIMAVTAEHGGMGITRERSYREVDGMATGEANLMLITYYADCVPIYFYDPVKRVIALTHSGWKGTLHDIGGNTVKVMENTYGCRPQDLHAALGPHIRDCCFEVDDDVAQPFRDTYCWAGRYIKSKVNGKRVIDLEGIIKQNLIRAGINKDNISGCRVCTCCHKDIFFSHRGSRGKTGTGAAFLMIRG